MIRRPPRSTQSRSSAASDVYKRQFHDPARLGDARRTAHLCVFGLAFGTAKGCALILDLLGHARPHSHAAVESTIYSSGSPRRRLGGRIAAAVALVMYEPTRPAAESPPDCRRSGS